MHLCHFGSRSGKILAHPPTLMRKTEDPLWDMGIGFGQVPDRGSHLQLPWEQGTFSFLSDSAGSEDTVQTLLRRPEPCPQPEVVEETRPLKAPRLHAPKLRAVADFRPTDAQAERQAAQASRPKF